MISGTRQGSRRTAPLELAGERLEACADATLYWERTKTLLIADAHFGKAAAFRSLGVPAPEDVHADLARLDAAIEATRCERLVVLGDLLHARAGRTSAVLDALGAWRTRRTQLEIVLIRGNHDRSAGDPPEALCIRARTGPVPMTPFALRHEPERDDAYTLAGHLHPAVVLEDPGTRSRARLRCFHFGARVGVLPAFGSFTGSKVVKPRAGDRVLVLTEGDVAEIGAGAGSTPS